MLKTPGWWYRRHGEGAPWWRFALWPLSLLWLAAGALRGATARPYRSSLFVISVGNATLGGSGKTPVAAEILRLLGRRAMGLSRGHGGALDGPVVVDPARHGAAEVGDEPLLLGRDHDMVIAKNRAAGLRLIEVSDARIAVVDDAHQNLTIAKDLHILVVDGDTADGAWPFGDGGICPYGPLREPLAQALGRADICVLWLPDAGARADPGLMDLLAPRPVHLARLDAARPPTGRVFGFAGIAKPWKFEATLRDLGCDIAGFRSFPDHAVLSEGDLRALVAEAGDARLITTEKDWVRLDPVWRQRIDRLPIVAKFDDESGFAATLEKAAGSR